MKNLILLTFLFSVLFLSTEAQTIEDLSAKELMSGQEFIIGNQEIDKGLVLIFHTMGCPFVNMYENRLNYILETYTSQGFSFVFVNPKKEELSEPTALRGHISEKNISIPYLMDENLVLTKFFEITKIPEIVLLTKGSDGIEVSYRGAFDNNPQVEASVTDRHFERAINQILKGEKPSPAQVRAMGCNVRTF